MVSEWIDKIIAWDKITGGMLLPVAQSIILLLVLLLVRFILLRVTRRRAEDVRTHYLWRRTINVGFGLLIILLITPIWFSSFGNVGTFLGLVSAGIAIALQDPLVNLAGWIFIMVRRPFDVGDRIEIEGTKGDVIDVRLFQTHLVECGNWVDSDQSTGRVIIIPNGHVFKKIVANYTRGFQHIWEEIHVLVTFESDWRKAKEILARTADEVAAQFSQGAEDQIRRAGRKQMIFFTKLTPIVYTTVKDSGIQLTMRYLVEPRKRRGAAQAIWEKILDAFEKEGRIDFAYPTIRYYQNQVEGKPETRPQN